MTGTGTRGVATDAVGASVALTLALRGANVAVALLARAAAIHAGFVAVHHVVVARDARSVEAGLRSRSAITIDVAFDARAIGVALLVAFTRRARLSEILDGYAVVAAFEGAIVTIAWRFIGVVVCLERRAGAVAHRCFAVAVHAAADDRGHVGVRRDALSGRAGPRRARIVLRTIRLLHARHGAA